MTLVLSKEEVDKIRPYKNYEFIKYPTRYPAFINFEDTDCGINGYQQIMTILEIPETVKCVESFIAGVQAMPIYYGESHFLGKRLEN